MERIKFIVAEKSYLVRKGIVSIINRIEKASVVSELDTIQSLNSEILKHNPHFLVINTSMLDGPEKFRNADIKWDIAEKGIAIQHYDGPGKGFAKKFREIIFIDDEKAVIFSKIETLIRESAGPDFKIIQNELSEREKSILKLVSKGLTNKEIAEKLFLSAHTVITHRKNITAKLGIKTISGLTVYAILNNIIALEDLKVKV